MNKEKISSRLPQRKPEHDFIMGAEKKHTIEQQIIEKPSFSFPWETMSLRDDVKKSFNLQLEEEYHWKIKFISDYTNKSQQKIIREMVKENIDNIIDQISKDNT